MESFTKGKEFCEKIIKGLNCSPTPYHIVERSKDFLTSAGFKEIKERYLLNNVIANLGKNLILVISSSLQGT